MHKVIAFDVFGTVVDTRGAHQGDLREYLRVIKLPEWQPLRLPASWETLPAHPGSADAIRRLRKSYTVVTCSNGPLGLLAKLSKAFIDLAHHNPA